MTAPRHRKARLLGYVRASTTRQETRLQRDALLAEGVKPGELYIDRCSGKGPRPQLARCMAAATRGDTIVVWKLDRVARSVLSLLTISKDLLDRGISLRSISEPWLDTSNAAGRLMRTVLGGMAEFERELLSERTKAGLVAARKRGKFLGAPRKLAPADVAEIEKELAAGGSIRQACIRRGIARVTFYRARAGYVRRPVSLPAEPPRTAKVGL